MKAIIIDTTDKMLVAVALNGEKTFSVTGDPDARRHTGEILVAIDSALKNVGFSIEEVEVVGVVVGPGSFTGIRIGVATALAIARASKAKLVSITSLEIPVFGEARVLSLLDCKHGYYAMLRDGDRVTYTTMSDEEIKLQTVKKVYVIGADADALIKVFKDKAERGEYSETVKPFYIKDSSAERNF